MIMDHPRCAQLQEGDVLLDVNGENVRNYAHNELVTVLKRCPKGNQASFSVLRQQSEVTIYNITSAIGSIVIFCVLYCTVAYSLWEYKKICQILKLCQISSILESLSEL